LNRAGGVVENGWGEVKRVSRGTEEQDWSLEVTKK